MLDQLEASPRGDRMRKVRTSDVDTRSLRCGVVEGSSVWHTVRSELAKLPVPVIFGVWSDPAGAFRAIFPQGNSVSMSVRPA